MNVEFEGEVKGINFKPVRKNKSEATITIVTESYNPGVDFADLMNKNGKSIKVMITDAEHEDALNTEPRSR